MQNLITTYVTMSRVVSFHESINLFKFRICAYFGLLVKTIIL